MSSENYNVIAWGGLRLYVLNMRTNIGRAVTRHSPARGSKHVQQDRGKEPEDADCELGFFDVPGEADPELRYLDFKKLVDEGEEQMLVHPIHGAYRARVRDGSMNLAGDTEVIVVNCTFVPTSDYDPVAELGAGAAPVAGPEAVEAAAANVDAELAELELETDVTTVATETVTAWNTDEISDARRVYLELATVTDQIDAAILELELPLYENWQAYREMIGLRTRLRDAAVAVASETEKLYSLTLAVGAPLSVICTQEYGASEGARQKAAVQKLNKVRNPAWVPAGTTLKMPVVVRR